jgi:hypothetical protein
LPPTAIAITQLLNAHVLVALAATNTTPANTASRWEHGSESPTTHLTLLQQRKLSTFSKARPPVRTSKLNLHEIVIAQATATNPIHRVSKSLMKRFNLALH